MVPVAPLWAPPRFVLRFCLWLQGVLLLGGHGLAGYLCFQAVLAMSGDLHGGGMAAMVFLLCWMAVLFLTITIHELGHASMARLSGMCLLVVQIGPWHVVPQRGRLPRCWMTWAHLRTHGGYVFAFADPSRPQRRAELAMIAGGPLFNLIAAGVAVVFLRYVADPTLWLACAIANGSTALANLLPTQKGMTSDGLWLLRWWRGMDRDHPDLTTKRVLGQMCFGLTCDRVPESDLLAMEQATPALSLLALTIRVKAAQLRGSEAPVVDALQVALEQRLHDNPALSKSEQVTLLRVELAYMRALIDRRLHWLEETRWSRTLRRSQPWLWARWLALHAKLMGNESLALKELMRAERMGATSPDRSLAPTEAVLREQIRALP